ncbi:hypothetical protein RS1P1_39990 [Pseudomonas moraviensis]|nr:hypothetical protein RS1P1_39990 [Pseudomonas moraviensis]
MVSFAGVPEPAIGEIVRAGVKTSSTICLIVSTLIRLGGGAQKAPSIGIQTRQRSNWYSKQFDQSVINQQKQIDTDLFQITPALDSVKSLLIAL